MACITYGVPDAPLLAEELDVAAVVVVEELELEPHAASTAALATPSTAMRPFPHLRRTDALPIFISILPPNM